MTHFKAFVIGEDAEEQLGLFDMNTIVPRYMVRKLTQEDKQTVLDYYKEGNDFEEVYSRHGEQWNRNRYVKDSAGVWWLSSVYNPDGMWDYHILGGRWEDSLVLKNGQTADCAQKGEIDWNKTSRSCFVFVRGNEWHAQGEVLCFGCSIDEYSDEEWGEIVWEMLDELADDTLISVYDLHQ